MKYLYLLIAAVILIAVAPKQAQAAPADPPVAQAVLDLKTALPGDAVLADGRGNHGRNDRGRDNRDRGDRNRNRDDGRGWQRNDDRGRGGRHGEFQWIPPWRWFLRWQWFHGDRENRGHHGHHGHRGH